VPEPESIRDICRGLVDKYRKTHHVPAGQPEMETVIDALANLPPVEGAAYQRDPYAFTGIDKMQLEKMGIDVWS
jgi:hypothetical protein